MSCAADAVRRCFRTTPVPLSCDVQSSYDPTRVIFALMSSRRMILGASYLPLGSDIDRDLLVVALWVWNSTESAHLARSSLPLIQTPDATDLTARGQLRPRSVG